MDNRFYKAIFKRKSFHRFAGTGDLHITQDELTGIEAAWNGFEPLYPDIRTRIAIVPESSTTCRRGGEYCILMYSEKKDGYLQNIGYLGEQMDLWLVSRDIGTLWFGIGKTDEKRPDGLEYVIMFSIRKIGDQSLFRKDMFKSKRKPVGKIWEGETLNVADIARFAPSACNTQPWFVRKEEDTLTVFRHTVAGVRGIMPAALVSFYNRIDIGIFLLILEVCLAEKGIVTERELFPDGGGKDEFIRNAVYKLKNTEEDQQ